jgi:hypothetical protein
VGIRIRAAHALPVAPQNRRGGWVGGWAVAQELRAACKEMYKSITRHHLVASDDAITCVQTAAQAASRAVRLANKAAVEQYPLDFLARFLAFQQALEEVHEVRLIVRDTRVRLMHPSALVWGPLSRNGAWQPHPSLEQ